MFALPILSLMGASCSGNEFDEDNDDIRNQIVPLALSINVKDVMGTRASGTGSSIDVLYYQVLDENGNPAEYVSNAETGGIITSELEELPLTKNQYPYEGLEIYLLRGKTYNIVFWAQKKECDSYEIKMPNVLVDYSKMKNNDDSFDAFCANLQIVNATGSYNKEVTLKRPFVQVNLGSIKDDWRASGIYKMQTVVSSLKVTGTADNLNIMTGLASKNSATTNETITVPYNEIFETNSENEWLNIDFNKNGVVDTTVTPDMNEEEAALVPYEQSRYISMSYFLIPGDDKTPQGSVDLEFSLDDEQRIHTISLKNAPVQRNWRTNIVGSLITSTVGIKVILDNDFDDNFDQNVDKDDENWNYTVTDKTE